MQRTLQSQQQAPNNPIQLPPAPFTGPQQYPPGLMATMQFLPPQQFQPAPFSPQPVQHQPSNLTPSPFSPQPVQHQQSNLTPAPFTFQPVQPQPSSLGPAPFTPQPVQPQPSSLGPAPFTPQPVQHQPPNPTPTQSPPETSTTQVKVKIGNTTTTKNRKIDSDKSTSGTKNPDGIPLLKPSSPPKEFPSLELAGNGWPVYDRGNPIFFDNLVRKNFYDQSEDLDFSEIFSSGRMQEDEFLDLERPNDFVLFEDDYAPKPLWDAMEPLNIYDFRNTFQKCMAAVGERDPLPHDLTTDEAGAIWFYCHEFQDKDHRKDNIYIRLNRVIAQKDTDGKVLWRDYIYHFLKGLRKMPRVKGNVYRGVNKGLLDNYKEGSIIYWNKFTSTSKSPDKAMLFMDGSKSTLFRIKVNYGYDISEISQFDEDEVIIEPGTAFKVTSSFDINAAAIAMIDECGDSVLLMHDANRSHKKGSKGKGKSKDKSKTGDAKDLTKLFEFYRIVADSISPAAISGDFPKDVSGIDEFYGAIAALEGAIVREAYIDTWFQFTRDRWFDEVGSPGPHSVRHAASCLFSLQFYIKPEARSQDWKMQENMFTSYSSDLGAGVLNSI